MPDALSFIRWQDIIDILVVSFIIHRIILLIQGTRAVQMLAGIIVITVIYFVSKQFDILTLHWLLKTFLSSILLVVIIVFQHDIRRALTQVGKTPFHKIYDVEAQDLFRNCQGYYLYGKTENRCAHYYRKRNRTKGLCRIRPLY